MNLTDRALEQPSLDGKVRHEVLDAQETRLVRRERGLRTIELVLRDVPPLRQHGDRRHSHAHEGADDDAHDEPPRHRDRCAV